jgi:hypothetical protein
MNVFERAGQIYLEGQLRDALEAAQLACEQQPKDADAWWLLGQVSRHNGMPNASDYAFRRAAALSADRPLPFRVTEGRFAELLEQARRRLAASAQHELAEVVIRVRPLPEEDLIESGLAPDADSHRADRQPAVLTLYQANLENHSPSEKALLEHLSQALTAPAQSPTNQPKTKKSRWTASRRPVALKLPRSG